MRQKKKVNAGTVIKMKTCNFKAFFDSMPHKKVSYMQIQTSSFVIVLDLHTIKKHLYICLKFKSTNEVPVVIIFPLFQLFDMTLF